MHSTAPRTGERIMNKKEQILAGHPLLSSQSRSLFYVYLSISVLVPVARVIRRVARVPCGRRLCGGRGWCVGCARGPVRACGRRGGGLGARLQRGGRSVQDIVIAVAIGVRGPCALPLLQFFRKLQSSESYSSTTAIYSCPRNSYCHQVQAARRLAGDVRSRPMHGPMIQSPSPMQV